MLRRFLDRYDGRLNPAKYAQMTDKSVDTAQRDLADLVAKGVFVRTGATSNVSYDLSPTIALPTRMTEPSNKAGWSVGDDQTVRRTKRP